MKISFIDFWSTWNPQSNIVLHLLNEVYENVEVTSPEECDVLIYGVGYYCTQNHRKYNHCKKISFSGECFPDPNYNECDYSINSSFNTYGGRNVRLPVWMQYIDFFGVGSYNGDTWLVPVKYLTEPNQFSKIKKTKFCSTVFTNPAKYRLEIIKSLEMYKKVDCRGHYFYNPLPKHHDGGEHAKVDFLKDYKFSICFENNIHPDGGYYTEKIIHAKVAGNVPIYFCDQKISYEMNDKSFLNLNNYQNVDNLVEAIVELDSDDKKYQNISNEPLFSTPPNLNGVKESFFKTFIF